MAEEGFTIEGRTYPVPTSFRLCDPVLVTQLTGMAWAAFVELLEDSEASDPTAMAGMIGVAVWQGNPKWTRDRVVRYVENIDLASVEVNAGEADASPPDAGTPSLSDGSPALSNPAQDGLSAPPETLSSTGLSESATTSPPSLQVA